MAGSTIGTLIEMVRILIYSSIETLQAILGKFVELGGNLGIVYALGGPAGAVMAIAILAAVIYLLGRFVLGTGKGLILLAIVGILLVMVVLFLV